MTYRIPQGLQRSRHGYLSIPTTDGIKLFSAPSKMPGFSFGIPALGANDPRLGGSLVTCPSAVTHAKRLGFTATTDDELVRELLAVETGTVDVSAMLDMPSVFDAICGGCYAKSGMYMVPDVIRALLERLVWTHTTLESDPDSWIRYIVTALTHQTRIHRHFRIQDSGDFYSVKYARAWLQVLERMKIANPQARFWAPVRGWYVARNLPDDAKLVRYQIRDTLKDIASLGNTTVRPSQLLVNVPAPHVDGMHAGTGVSTTGAYNCPAHEQNNECQSCRVCWEEPDRVVVYRGHSRLQKRLPVING